MGRIRRSHLPGAVFHLTARTQGREPWFREELRSRMVRYVAETIGASDARLLAYAIMPNHLHLVVLQGDWPLGQVVQPLLRRVALLVQRARGTGGHVFERRFRERPCLDAEYVRNAILYTHLNPVRAGLVVEPGRYPWSSHGLYAGSRAERKDMSGALATDLALPLFASRYDGRLAELRRDYGAHVAWRIQCDRHAAAEEEGHAAGPPPSPPAVSSGDMHWACSFAPLLRSCLPWPDVDMPRSRPSWTDLSEIAKRTLAERAAGLDLNVVRSSDKSRAAVHARHTMIRRMSAAGHRGSSIARYLRVSDQCVSNVLVAGRHQS